MTAIDFDKLADDLLTKPGGLSKADLSQALTTMYEYNNNNNSTSTTNVTVEPVQADRYNTGKPEYSMLDLTCFESCVQVLMYGATKYSRDNWRKGMPQNKILDSLMRHIARIQDGEDVDPESGLLHIGHIQCNAMFLGNRNNTKEE